MKLNKWDKRFLDLAAMVGGWSKDPSTQQGCVIVDSRRRVISVGYNGFPRMVNDAPARYEDRPTKYGFVVHAEANAILNANTSVDGCVLYTGMYPCSNCAKLIVQAGITEVITPAPIMREPWAQDAKYSETMFLESKVKVRIA